MNKTDYHGGCLCGKVRFTISGDIHDIVYCHCSQCRKAQGSAFATNGNVASDNFTITSGKDELTAYQSSPGHTRFFCRVCGSPIMSSSSARLDHVRVRLGTIEADIRERPIAHIFVTSKANWDEISGNIPQYEYYEPGRRS